MKTFYPSRYTNTAGRTGDETEYFSILTIYAGSIRWSPHNVSVYTFGQNCKLGNKESAEENPIRTKVLRFYESKSISGIF